MNATDTLKAKNQTEENAARILNDMLLDFAARYAPRHPRDRDYFNAALTTVVRQVTLDAHRVYGEQVTAMVRNFYNAAPLVMVSPGQLDRMDLSGLKPGGVTYTPQTTPLYPPRPGMLPNKPGFYWAKLVRPAGMPDNETAADWMDDTYQPVDVFNNGGEDDEKLMVFVIGRNAAQRLDAFEWGQFIGGHE